MISDNTSLHRNILITGAGSGIGLATALELSTNKRLRVFAGVRDPADVEKLQELSEHLQPLWLDITSTDSISAAVQSFADSDVHIDVLINNAGYSLACPLEFTPMEEFRHQFEVNVCGQLSITQAMLPQLRMTHGRIINVTSLSGYISGPFVGPYAASKHAFASLSESMRLELRRQDIRVIQIIPGDIKTPIWDKSRQAADALRDQLADSISQRLPEDVRSAYAADLQAMRAATAKFADNALPVQRVVRAIQHATLSQRPRSHYIIGAKAWGAVRLLRFFPSSWRDRIILNNLGMKS